MDSVKQAPRLPSVVLDCGSCKKGIMEVRVSGDAVLDVDRSQKRADAKALATRTRGRASADVVDALRNTPPERRRTVLDHFAKDSKDRRQYFDEYERASRAGLPTAGRATDPHHANSILGVGGPAPQRKDFKENGDTYSIRCERRGCRRTGKPFTGRRSRLIERINATLAKGEHHLELG